MEVLFNCVCLFGLFCSVFGAVLTSHDKVIATGNGSNKDTFESDKLVGGSSKETDIDTQPQLESNHINTEGELGKFAQRLEEPSKELIEALMNAHNERVNRQKTVETENVGTTQSLETDLDANKLHLMTETGKIDTNISKDSDDKHGYDLNSERAIISSENRNSDSVEDLTKQVISYQERKDTITTNNGNELEHRTNHTECHLKQFMSYEECGRKMSCPNTCTTGEDCTFPYCDSLGQCQCREAFCSSDQMCSFFRIGCNGEFSCKDGLCICNAPSTPRRR